MIEIKHNDNFYKHFKEGFLHIVGKEAVDNGEGPNKLYLGKFYSWYFIKLNDLGETMNNFFPFAYHKVINSNCIKARETLNGGLEVKIEREEFGLKFKSKAVFSKKEYDIIRDYIDVLKLG